MRTSPLPADFIHARACKPICEKYLTLPERIVSLLGLLGRNWNGKIQLDGKTVDKYHFFMSCLCLDHIKIAIFGLRDTLPQPFFFVYSGAGFDGN